MAATAPALGLQLADEVGAEVKHQGRRLFGQAVWLEHGTAHVVLPERLKPGSEVALTLIHGTGRVDLLATVLITRVQPAHEGSPTALHVCSLVVPPHTSRPLRELLERVNPRSGGADLVSISSTARRSEQRGRRRDAKPVRHVPRRRRRMPPPRALPQAIPRAKGEERRRKPRKPAARGLASSELAKVKLVPGVPVQLEVTFWDKDLWSRSARWSHGRFQIVLADSVDVPQGELVGVELTLPSGEICKLHARIAHRGRERVVLEARNVPARAAIVLDRWCRDDSGSDG